MGALPAARRTRWGAQPGEALMPSAENLAKAREIANEYVCLCHDCADRHGVGDDYWRYYAAEQYAEAIAAALDAERARAEAVVEALKRIATFANHLGPSDEARIAEAAVAEWEAR